jgi:hypothetical protein
MKKFSVFILFALCVVGALYFLSGDDYSNIPDDADHWDINDKSLCMECHGPGEENALKDSHPPKYECLRCHKHVKENISEMISK